MEIERRWLVEGCTALTPPPSSFLPNGSGLSFAVCPCHPDRRRPSRGETPCPSRSRGRGPAWEGGRWTWDEGALSPPPPRGHAVRPHD